MSRKYKVEFEIPAQRTLRKLDRHQAMIIMGWIHKHLAGCSDPRSWGKPLVANHSGAWRYRVGDYRIIAHSDDDTITILVLAIGHRREIYSDMSFEHI